MWPLVSSFDSFSHFGASEPSFRFTPLHPRPSRLRCCSSTNLSFASLFPLSPLTDPAAFWSVALAFPIYRAKTFMQPEPLVVSQTSSTDANPASPSTSSQHGNDRRCDEPVFDSLPPGNVGDRRVVDDVDSAIASSQSAGDASHASLLRRLNRVDSLPTFPAHDGSEFGSPPQAMQSRSADSNAKVYAFRMKPRQSLADLPNGKQRYAL